MSVMESVSLTALREIPSKFCVNLKTDLERLILSFENEMKSLNCEIEVISPRKKRGRGKGKKTVNDYSLNIEEFSATKRNIFDKMQKYFSELEGKWNADFKKLSNQISSSMEKCLTNVQLSIKVVEEVEVEDSDSEESVKEVTFTKACSTKRSNSHLADTSSKNKKTDWRPLLSVVEDAPEISGVYEVKVWRAKKCAYIGHCENLLKRLSLHREKASTGQKYLDQFISRNNNDIVVRYDTFPSAQAAKMEEKRRLKSFLDKYNNLPSYNYKL